MSIKPHIVADLNLTLGEIKAGVTAGGLTITYGNTPGGDVITLEVNEDEDEDAGS